MVRFVGRFHLNSSGIVIKTRKMERGREPNKSVALKCVRYGKKKRVIFEKMIRNC